MYYLFLDDLRMPGQVKWVDLPAANWTIVRSYDEFVKTVSAKGIPMFVSFDHDLGIDAMMAANRREVYSGPEKTGYHCALWLLQKCADEGLKFPKWTCHSINPVGRRAIEQLLNKAR